MIGVKGITEQATCDFCGKDRPKVYLAVLDGKDVALCTTDFERQVRLAMKISKARKEPELRDVEGS